MIHKERINWANAETDWKKEKTSKVSDPVIFPFVCFFGIVRFVIQKNIHKERLKIKRYWKKLVIGRIECVLTEICLSNPRRNSVLTVYVVLAQNRKFKFSSNVLCSEASFAGDYGTQGSPEPTEFKLKFE